MLHENKTKKKKIGIIYGLIFCGHLRFITVNSELFYYKILSKHFFKKKNPKEGKKKKNHNTTHGASEAQCPWGRKRGAWGEKS